MNLVLVKVSFKADNLDLSNTWQSGPATKLSIIHKLYIAINKPPSQAGGITSCIAK